MLSSNHVSIKAIYHTTRHVVTIIIRTKCCKEINAQLLFIHKRIILVLIDIIAAESSDEIRVRMELI